MKKALITLLALSSLLPLYCDDLTEIELIVVSRTPRGIYAGEVRANGSPFNFGWYDIGLSRNGKEPIEYIWRADAENGFAIRNAEIGDKGTVYLRDWWKQFESKLSQPNAENPPVVGMLGEVYWRKAEPILIEKSDFVLRFPYVETDSPELFLHKYQGKDKNVIIPSDLNIIEIDSRVFTESGVVSVTIPEGVKKLRGEAFAFCRDLTTIILPSSVTSIAESAFDNCGNLAEIIVYDNNSEYSSREGVLFNINRTTLIKYPEGKQGGIQ